MARECVAISLSPKPYFEFDKTYAVYFCASCNLQTAIRRRIPSDTTPDYNLSDDNKEHHKQIQYDEAADTTIPTPKICTPRKFSSYWIALHDRSKLSVGLGTVSGVDCVATLDNSVYHALRSGLDTVSQVGIGNSPGMQYPFRQSPQSTRDSPPLPLRRRRQRGDGTLAGPSLHTPLHPNTGTTGKDASIEQQTQYDKAKKKAEKLRTKYRQPPPDDFFKWTEARRLRANPERGFVTGIDILSVEDREKTRKRKERIEYEDVNWWHPQPNWDVACFV